MAFYQWSTVATNNGTADSTCPFPEGMSPSAVNDGVRGAMARLREYANDTAGQIVATGAGTAGTPFAVTTGQGFTSLTVAVGQEVCFQIPVDVPATAVINVDGLGAKPYRPAAGVEFVAGQQKAGSIQTAVYYTTNGGEWIAKGYSPTVLAAGQVNNANLNGQVVNYGNIQNETNNTLLGNVSGGAAPPEEITIGQGLVVTGTTLKAPAFPVPGGFKNLSIKVATNTTITVAADFVSTTDGTNFQTTALSGTINMGTAGVANALDAGTIAIDTWYFIYAIAKPDGTTAALASTSSTAPTLPTGYTFKARIGAVKTAHGSAILLGSIQYGRRAQWVVGLAGLTTAQVIASGSAGNPATPTWVALTVNGGNVQASYVPSTAASIRGWVNDQGGGASIIAAPNNSYSGNASLGNGPPVITPAASGTISCPFEFILESASIYWANAAASGAILALGWEDNI